MTSETVALTEPWVESTGMQYAYAYDKGARLMGKVGGTGLPHAVLVAPDGNVAWSGHPAELSAAQIEPVLTGALSKPLWEWPKEADKVKKALMKRQLGTALQEARALGEAGAQVVSTLEAMIASKLASLKTARDGGDWLGVDELGAELSKSFAGLPQLADVEEITAALEADKAAQEILKAQRRVQKFFAEDIKKKQIEKIEKELERIAKDYAGTAAERDARAGIKDLAKLREELANR